MAQTIIAYIIIGVAAGYAIYSIVKKLKAVSSNDKTTCDSSCTDCSCCGKISQCKIKK